MRDDVFYLKEIINQCDKIKDRITTFGDDEEDFADNEAFQTSCAFHITQVGEAVKLLSSECRGRHQDVDWKSIAGLRDIIVHDYGKIRTDSLWLTITVRIPELRESCERIVAEICSNTRAEL